MHAGKRSSSRMGHTGSRIFSVALQYLNGPRSIEWRHPLGTQPKPCNGASCLAVILATIPMMVPIMAPAAMKAVVPVGRRRQYMRVVVRAVIGRIPKRFNSGEAWELNTHTDIAMRL